MLKLQAGSKDFAINLPTSIKELTPEVLGAVTANIKLAPYHAIVALCFQVKLMTVAINVNGDKPQTMSVIPVLAKISDDDSTKMNANVGDRLVLDRSSLERGIHLNLPTMISSKNVATYIGEDETLRQNLVKGGDGSESSQEFILNKSAKEREELLLKKSPNVFVLEFKVVPVNDINISISADEKLIDPFKSVATKLVS